MAGCKHHRSTRQPPPGGPKIVIRNIGSEAPGGRDQWEGTEEYEVTSGRPCADPVVIHEAVESMVLAIALGERLRRTFLPGTA